jgi:hypothetical protein
MRDEPGIGAPLRLTVSAVSVAFFLLASLFILHPAEGATLFGLATEDRTALFFVRAVGLRDLALAIYLLALAYAGDTRPLVILLAGTIVIPVGDLVLLLNAGVGSNAHSLLHFASSVLFASLACWAHARGRRVNQVGAGSGMTTRRQ